MNLGIMKQRIGDWKSVRKAVLRDYKFVFMPRPGIVIPVIVPSKGDRVLGAIWDIREDQLREIDRFERPYSKRTVEVETEEGRVEALAYVFDMKEFIASVNGYKADWMEGLRQHEFGEEEISEVERIMAESIEELSR